LSYLRYLCLLACPKHCVMFLLCLSSSCLPYAASFSRLFIVGYPFGILYNIYLQD